MECGTFEYFAHPPVDAICACPRCSDQGGAVEDPVGTEPDTAETLEKLLLPHSHLANAISGRPNGTGEI
jgi:hypothetical protein